ncbi:hypothetical protein V6N13_074699 [Hibiscus sabdariffa]
MTQPRQLHVRHIQLWLRHHCQLFEELLRFAWICNSDAQGLGVQEPSQGFDAQGSGASRTIGSMRADVHAEQSEIDQQRPFVPATNCTDVSGSLVLVFCSSQYMRKY